jgi:hypothetical protein
MSIVSAMQEGEVGGSQSKAGPGKSKTLSDKYSERQGVWSSDREFAKHLQGPGFKP